MLKENFIVIDNVAELDIVTILSNIASMYSTISFTDGIKLSKYNNSNRKFLITFRNTPDFVHFAYVVNYLYYPEDVKSS